MENTSLRKAWRRISSLRLSTIQIFWRVREIQTDLYEAVEAADLPEVRCLPDEEEADVAEIPLDLGAGNIGERGEVDGVAVLGGSLKRLDRCGIHATFRPNI